MVRQVKSFAWAGTLAALALASVAARAESNPHVRRVMTRLVDGRFSPDDRDLFAPIARSLLEHGDYYMHLSDFAAYEEQQERAVRDYVDAERWSARAIINVARSAHFSSDRTIQEYASEIWDLQQVV